MERSVDKTKRKMINLLSNNQWKYQYSIFCDVQDLDYEDAKDAAIAWIHDFNHKKLRDGLRKVCNTAILFIVRTHFIRNRPDRRRVKQIYLTIFCNEILNLDICQRYTSYPLNVVHRKVSEWKITTTCNALQTQALHDLSSLNGMKRYSVINSSLLIPKVVDE